MSRYSATTTNGAEVSYGFDNTCGYFYQEWSKEVEEPVVDLDSHLMGGLSRGKFLELLENTDAPKKHRMSIALDLPF